MIAVYSYYVAIFEVYRLIQVFPNTNLFNMFLYDMPICPINLDKLCHLVQGKCFIYSRLLTRKLKLRPITLTLSQTTNFRLFQTERVCRRQY